MGGGKENFQKEVLEQLNKYCPEKVRKISSQDKPWVTTELKKLSRQKSRIPKKGENYSIESWLKDLKTNINWRLQNF